MSTPDNKQSETMEAAEDEHDRKTNADGLTGEHGAHPMSVAVGATVGAAAGAAMGSIGGPVGVVAGAAAGAIAGGLAGKSAGEAIDPTVEDSYWRENYLNRSYIAAGKSYEYYQPAYRHGWTSFAKHGDRDWASVESTLQSEWNAAHPGFDWNEATPAARDAWERLEKAKRS